LDATIRTWGNPNKAILFPSHTAEMRATIPGNPRNRRAKLQPNFSVFA